MVARSTAGLRCEKCGGRTRTFETRHRKLGGIRRRRACEDCGERFTTIEMRWTPTGASLELESMQLDAMEKLKRLQRALRAAQLTPS